MNNPQGGSKTLAMTIADRLRAGALVVVVKEPDEQLAVEAVRAAASPFGDVEFVSGADSYAQTKLEEHPTDKGKGVLVLLDFLAIYGDNPLSARLVREVALQRREDDTPYSRLILIEFAATKVPTGILGDVEIVAPPLPGIESLLEELDSFAEEQGTKGLDDEARYAIAGAACGLSRHEAARLFAMCWVEKGALDAAWIGRNKARKVTDKLSGALTFESELSADVGGMDSLKEWLRARKAAFASAKAKEFGLPEPKGLLLVGVPGCGKSLNAKTIAREWGLPLLRLDIGKAMGSLVGQSEAQIRAAIEAAEACSPCVLWVDEIEKGLAGSAGGGDSGTSQRVFGTVLTWLQEKTSPVFVVATANRISGLPPELLRKGRFDEIFFVGLPDGEDRSEITRIHLSRKNRTLADDAITKIVSATSGFSGAEIEQAIVSGLFGAYSEGRDLVVDDVLSAIASTSPISKTMAAEIDRLTKWAEGRARFAAGEKNKTTKKGVRRGPAISKRS